MKKYHLIKRIVDIMLSAFLLTLLLPIIIFFCIALFILEGRPIFYVSSRMVSPGESIKVFKFRTMIVDATAEKYALEKRFMHEGYLNIPLDCEVYTPIGRILERTQLVEIFQLINIFFGKLSFVGNRPLPQKNLNELKKFNGWEERFISPGGLTGITQVIGKFQLTGEERITLERIYSTLYQKNEFSLLLCDFMIIYRTALLILFGLNWNLDNAIKFMMKFGVNFKLTSLNK